MKFILLAIAALLLTGCATKLMGGGPGLPSHPYGQLKTSWYEGINGKPAPEHFWDEWTHMCQYESGVVVNAGRKQCP